MASQLDMLLEQDSGLVIPGDTPSFASIYSDMGAAAQATADWTRIITNGLSRVVDLEIMSRYSGNNQTPRIVGGQPAGTVGMTAQTMAPWLMIGGAVLVAWLLLRK